MFKKKTKPTLITKEEKEKTIPTYLRDDYPYKDIGEACQTSSDVLGPKLI